ncbi:TonB-dependent receptor domain-containing protein [Mangrovimonas futianensis]|uniref:TonB-dependent receptor domain-containing protein n=1 Tax=Mangrovimonas futianensis TaxID=2895523 RepID=UPI001E479CEE|nr:outer membrane beta-barrel family protein [Mangrovimonas futianensis]MCF1421320.1 TonB-dependent receptor [Mangrovimonas futianensis]
MKSFILFLGLFMCFTFTYSQTSVNLLDKQGLITGKVLDSKLQQPLPYVTIVVKNKSGVTITGGITDDNGDFKITSVPDGDLVVSVQYIGYKTVSRNITIDKNNKNIELGNILLEEEATSLNEVTIVAETSTIEQKVDRKVINVGKDLTTSGVSASDIMNNIPSVSVDQQTGNISLRGNENVRVMVDGKLSNVPVAQLLKQIPSTSIKSIELITNPSAKYNPEGMSGIINIILHKNTKLGFNGNLNFGLTKEINARFNSSIDMNYRNGKFNLYGNYGNNIGSNTNYGTIYRAFNESEQNVNFLNNNKSHLYKVGLDFYMNDKNTLSFFTNQNLYDGKGNGVTTIFYDNAPTEIQDSNDETDNNTSQYNLAYKREFKKEGEQLDIEVDYNVFDQNQTANFDFTNIPTTDYTDHVDTNRDQTTINVDYVNPLNDNTKLELGGEVRLFNSDIYYDSSGFTFNSEGNIAPTPSTDFDYGRNIYSAYATFGKNYEKWTYQVGARFESVTVDAEALRYTESGTEVIPFENDYIQVYPSAFLTYNPSDKNTYQLSFSRRVDRPGLQQVNPIREWSTPLISSYGNTELQPQFTNSIESNYTRKLKNGSLTAGVFYRIIEDEINRAVFIDRLDLEKVILSYDNFSNTSAYGLELSSNYRPTKWWSFNASFDLYSRKQKGVTEILSTTVDNATIDDISTQTVTADNVVWNFRVFNNFKVTKQLALSLFAMYRGREEGIQLNRKPMYFVNSGLRYSFLQDQRATFSFNYNDIFNTMQFRFDGDTPYPSTGEFNWESNTWNVSLAYRFGGGKYRALSRKQRDNNVKSGEGGFM